MLIWAAQNQELDVRKLVLKLRLYKCRLYTWGEAMRLIQSQEQSAGTA
jgi:Prion-inhibition and propagation